MDFGLIIKVQEHLKLCMNGLKKYQKLSYNKSLAKKFNNLNQNKILLFIMVKILKKEKLLKLLISLIMVMTISSVHHKMKNLSYIF